MVLRFELLDCFLCVLKVPSWLPTGIVVRESLPLDEVLYTSADLAFIQDGLHFPFFLLVDDFRVWWSRYFASWEVFLVRFVVTLQLGDVNNGVDLHVVW